MQEENKLPRPSVEVLKKYDELYEKLDDKALAGEEYDETINAINDIISSYDLSNYEFTDPVTGLKGVKDPAGQVIVPACYDAFSFIGDQQCFTLSHMSAKKGGKWGVVSADGSNTVLCDFRFDYLQWYPFTATYLARWDGVADKFGLVNKEGRVFIPNVLTNLHEPWNDFMLLESDGKFGALDTSTFFFVLPEYDKIDADPDELVVFHKDGVEGYVIEETGEFIPKEQFDDNDQYDDVYVYNTNINV